MNDLLLGLHQDPFVATVVVGLLWPLVQAALDRPYWTPRRRKILLAVVALIVTAGVWVSGSYPATWQMLVTQASVFLGIAWAVFQVLSGIKINGASIIDWAGVLTPGGETVGDMRLRALMDLSDAAAGGGRAQ